MLKNINQSIFSLYYHDGLENNHDFSIKEPVSPLMLNPTIFNSFSISLNSYLNQNLLLYSIETSPNILKTMSLETETVNNIVENLFQIIHVANKDIYSKKLDFNLNKLSGLLFDHGNIKMIRNLNFISNLAQKDDKRNKIFQDFKNKLIYEDLFAKKNPQIIDIFINMAKLNFINKDEILKILKSQEILFNNKVNDDFISSAFHESYFHNSYLDSIIKFKNVLNEKQIHDFNFAFIINKTIENVAKFQEEDVDEKWLKK